MPHVTFPAVGRMGNFLFECATSIAYALKHELNFTVPLHTTDAFWSPIYLTDLQDKSYDNNLEKIELWENGHEYQEIPFDESWRQKNIIIHGYRQSEKYFKDYRNEILYLFNYPWKLEPICSLHARYGDYLTIPGKHIIIDEEYILSAIKYIKENTGIVRFKVFSDNIPLFIERHGKLYNFEYSSNTSEEQDLIEMSCCHSHINSSSTFSWWSAWLNKNTEKIVVTPKDWFQRGWMNMNVNDIIPENWIKL